MRHEFSILVTRFVYLAFGLDEAKPRYRIGQDGWLCVSSQIGYPPAASMINTAIMMFFITSHGLIQTHLCAARRIVQRSPAQSDPPD